MILGRFPLGSEPLGFGGPQPDPFPPTPPTPPPPPEWTPQAPYLPWGPNQGFRVAGGRIGFPAPGGFQRFLEEDDEFEEFPIRDP